MMFIIGTGSNDAEAPPTYRYRRQLRISRRRLGHRQADAQNSIRTEARFVRCTVQLDQRAVERDLVAGFHADDGIGDFFIDRFNRAQHALAAVTLGIFVPQLDRFMRTGGCAGRHRRAPEGAAGQFDIGLDRRIAAAIQNFAGMDIG